MHPCNFDATLTASPKILVSNFSFPTIKPKTKNVLISYVCMHYKCRNKASAWRHFGNHPDIGQLKNGNKCS